jgi:C-terminal processing protease CtpA/Prc
MDSVKNYLSLVGITGLLFFAACKKKDLDNGGTTPTPPPVVSTDKVKDTAVQYSKDIYLWYKQIPATFTGQSYTDLQKLMTGLRQYSTEPGFTSAVDRWSFAIKQKEWDDVSSGISGDFGLGVFFNADNDLRVKLVEKASPAGKAGIRRGWRITKINGNSNISTSNTDLVIKGVFESTATSFTFQKPDNSTVDINLTAATYQEHPILVDTVYNIASKKIGYFALNSFLGDTSEMYREFARIFSRFEREQVADVIVDLRYNGGGYVSVQERLANYLAPAAANGNIMMKQEFNDKYTSYNSTSNYRKLGSLNLNRIFFIVSNSTASASELLINNLKPYAQTILVGPSKTYGKPVGYFPIPVGDWYIFPVSFRTTNKNGEGSYFSGLALNSQLADGLDKDWGDVSEALLASAIKFSTTGAFRTMNDNAQTYIEQPAVISGNTKLDEPSFKGTIGTQKFK